MTPAALASKFGCSVAGGGNDCLVNPDPSNRLTKPERTAPQAREDEDVCTPPVSGANPERHIANLPPPTNSTSTASVPRR